MVPVRLDDELTSRMGNTAVPAERVRTVCDFDVEAVAFVVQRNSYDRGPRACCFGKPFVSFPDWSRATQKNLLVLLLHTRAEPSTATEFKGTGHSIVLPRRHIA